MRELCWHFYSRLVVRGAELGSQSRSRPWLRPAASLVTELALGLERLERRLARGGPAAFPRGFRSRPRPWSGPLVSVIITCYNYGRYLDRVLAVLENQSLRNFEIILIDDGSDDPLTVAKIEQLQKRQESGFTVLRQANRGVVAARNRAIASARGRYIFPLDADDTIDKTFLEKTLFFLEHSPDDTFVYTWTRACGSEDFIWPTRDCPPGPVLQENRMGYAVFRKSAFVLVGGYNPVMDSGYEDWELCVNFVAHGFCGRVIREPSTTTRSSPEPGITRPTAVIRNWCG